MKNLTEHQEKRKKALVALTALRQLRNLDLITMEEHKTIYIRMNKEFEGHLSVLR